ncbi:MAG: hypothetical protein ACN4EP_02150 [Sediminibacterium sp.]|nr:hypothetical protein [uncultured Sediminibacterium sp.]
MQIARLILLLNGKISFETVAITVRGNWLQAASHKLQALMGAYFRLSAILGINDRVCEFVL